MTGESKKLAKELRRGGWRIEKTAGKPATSSAGLPVVTGSS